MLLTTSYGRSVPHFVNHCPSDMGACPTAIRGTVKFAVHIRYLLEFVFANVPDWFYYCKSNPFHGRHASLLLVYYSPAVTTKIRFCILSSSSLVSFSQRSCIFFNRDAHFHLILLIFDNLHCSEIQLFDCLGTPDWQPMGDAVVFETINR